jgi:hypothetical protein
MPLHFPYIAEPKFYYYFRPYNWFHIPVQQDDVRAFGGDPRHPYDNRIFQSVYEQLDFDPPTPEHLNVPPTPAEAKKQLTPAPEMRSIATEKSPIRTTSSASPDSPKGQQAAQRSSLRIRPVLSGR